MDRQCLTDRIVDLPTLPKVAARLVRLLDDPRSSAKDISGLMGTDPVLAAKVLKMVNSAFYGLPNRVADVRQAIAILGYATIKGLVVSTSVFGLFAKDRDGFSHADFWSHSLATGLLARRL